VGELVQEEFQSPGPGAVATQATGAEPDCSTLPGTALVAVPGQVGRPTVGGQGQPAHHCAGDGGLAAEQV
jgi:hypothetical protein